jgi:oligopeptide transport system permease protein
LTARIRVAVVVLLLVGLLALLAPMLSPWDQATLDWQHLAVPPQWSASHWLGTDRLGRDLFVRGMQGLRISLTLGVLATLVSVCIGVTWGAVAGYLGGRTDALMMRVVDIVYALPYVFIVIILSTLLPRGSLAGLFIAIGAVGWLTMARIVRGQTLSLRRREFITAAVAGGVRTPAILWRHIVPNVLHTVVAYATLTVPQVILFESFLSFLGLGVQEPYASLGSLINEGAQEMETSPWMLLVPATLLVLVLGAFSVLGDALRARVRARDV